MNQWIHTAMVTMLLGAMHGSANAQERIYRCGNEYTNNAALASQGSCKVVSRGHVTVVHTDAKALTPKGTANPSASVNGRSVPTEPSNEQKARDKDARAILESELTKARTKLQELKAEFNGGNPDRTALELRNPQIFQERLEALKAHIARQEADVAGIQRELERRTGS